MQYILDEYEYERLKNGADEKTDSLYNKIDDLQKILDDKIREIRVLKGKIERYRNKYGLLEETSWTRTEEARCSGGFNF